MTIENLKINDIDNIEKFKVDREKSKKLTGLPNVDKPWQKYYSEEAIEATIPQVTVYTNLKNVAMKKNDDIAIIYFGTKITYKQLLNKIDLTADAFLKEGINPGDIVTLMLPNIPENTICFYALNKIGAISNFIDLRTKNDELAECLAQSHSKIIVGTDMFLDNLLNLEDKIGNVKIIVASPKDSLPFIFKKIYGIKNKVSQLKSDCILWKNFVQQASNNKKDKTFPFNTNNGITILYTSGTTGKPKGVMLTNENFMAMVTQYKYCGLEFNPRDKFLNQVPPFLAYNIVMGTNLPLSLGMTIVMLPDYQPTKFAKNIYKTKVNHAIAGPADWSNFLDDESIRKNNFSFLKTLASGGGHLDPTKVKKINEILNELGCKNKVIEGYGMTEAATAVCTNLPQCNVSNSAGIPLPKMNVGICDINTKEFLPYNVSGELCFNGPTVMKGYFQNDEATQKVLISHGDGQIWLHSGDIGFIDENGVVHINGRLKRVIVRYDGFNVYPNEIESVIMQHPDVESCCVVGLPDEIHKSGSIPIACVLINKNSTKSKDKILEELHNLCSSKIIDIHLPAEYISVDNIPLTKVGKVDYLAVEKALATKKSQENTYQKTLTKKRIKRG